MKNRTLVLVCIVGLMSGFEPIISQDLIFYASFDSTLLSSEMEEPALEEGTSFASGIFGQGVLIDGQDQLQYPILNNIDPQKGSLSMWVQPNWNPGDILYRIFMLGSEPRNFELHLDEGSSLTFAINTAQQDGKPIKFTQGYAGDWEQGNWYFLTYTWDNEAIKIFVNGVEVGYSDVGFEIPLTADANFHIGSLNGELPFMGLIDEVKIYDGALSNEEVLSVFNDDLDRLPLANEIKITDIFGTDITQSGITLVDWEGPIMNPALKYYINGSEALTYPQTITLTTKIENSYFDLPSTVSKNGASKSVFLESAASLDSILMSYYMDKDFEDENFDLSITYQYNGVGVKQIIPVRVIDQDYDRPLSYPVTVDFSEAIDPFLNDPVIQEIVVGAAEDWLYYVDGEGIDPIGVGESELWVGGQDHNFEEKIVNNPVAYTGYYLYAYENTTELGPCFCSTGFPNVQQLQTKNGEVVPIPRIGGLHLNKFGQDYGDIRPDGWEVSSPYDNWTFEGFMETDLYSIAKHEIGHAMVFEELPLFDAAQNRLGFVSPALTEYYEDTIVPLYPESLSHLYKLLDPASLQTLYGGGVEQPIMASGREMLTKLDVLIMESVGYPLRENEVTRPLTLAPDTVFTQVVNEAVDWKLLAKGGIPVYHYELVEGALPEGLTLESTSGRITGSPVSEGSFPVTFNLRDYDQRKSGVRMETIITVISEGSSAAELISFVIENQIGETVVDAEANTLHVLMPHQTDLTALTADIEISEGATISPGGELDYSVPVVFTITSENGVTQITWTVIVEEDIASSLKDLSLLQFSLFPNPVGDQVRLEFQLREKQDVMLQIFDLTGQLFENKSLGKVGRWEEWLDVSKFHSGLYFVQLVGEVGPLAFRKLIKL